MKRRAAAIIAAGWMGVSLAGCGSNSDDRWAVAERSLGSPGGGAHPHLVSAAIELEPGWEYARSGPWYADQRRIPDYPPFDGAAVFVYERLSISNGRPREHVHWTTFSHQQQFRPHPGGH